MPNLPSKASPEIAKGAAVKAPMAPKASKASNVIFFHGGPGLTSFCERDEIAPLLSMHGFECLFWNEPSANRPSGDAYREEAPFEGWISSAEACLLGQARDHGPVHVIAHSFAVAPALELARRHAGAIASLILLSPGFDLHDLQKNILGIACRDFMKTDPAAAERLQTFLGQTQSVFDGPIEQGFQIALGDPLLLSHYWSQQQAMDRYLGYLSRPDAMFDLKALFGVLKDYARHVEGGALRSGRVDVPSLVVFGEKDPVVSTAWQTTLALRSLENPQVAILPELRHYPHLEDKEAFIRLAVPFLHRESMA